MNYERKYNFSAGPAMMPEAVLEEVAAELLNYRGSGMSVMEMSHRSRVYQTILEETEADLRALLAIPNNYRVLFLQGGGTLQFSMVPMNLMAHGAAEYLLTGAWSQKAMEEARKFGTVYVPASSQERGYWEIPALENLSLHPESDYVYICENETIHGTCYPSVPDTMGKPLVSDQSSLFLSKPCSVSDYGLIFAGVQKNVGPAGLAIVIIREDLIRGDLPQATPVYLEYATHAGASSLYNTPNCWAIYVCGKVFRYLRSTGGLDAMARRNEEKARVLYDFLDRSSFYSCPVKPPFRSLMNVPFFTPNPELDAQLVAFSQKAGLENLKGHRSVGGMRASLFNAMPLEGVKALVACLEEFAQNCGES